MSSKLQPVEIYYTLCPPYHGATLISAFLNNHSKITSLGDTFPIRNLDPDCICGKKVSECNFWQNMYNETSLSNFSEENIWFPLFPKIIQPNVVNGKRLNIIFNTLILGLSIPFGSIVWKTGHEIYQEYYQTYIELVNFITKRNESTIFIDGSKSSFKPFFIQSYSKNKVPAKVIHITRSPFNFAYSFYKNLYKIEGGKDDKNRIQILEKAAKLWLSHHRKILLLKKIFLDKDSYLRVSYENFCAYPENSVASMIDFMKLNPENLLTSPRFPKKNHIIGNKSILSFDGTIVKSKWNNKLSPNEIERIYDITKPLLTEFGLDIP